MRFTFRFRLIPFVAAAIAVAIGLSLGQWQTRRAAEKIAIEQKLQIRQAAPALQLGDITPHSDEIEYRRVLVKGEFLRDWPIYLDNRPHNGVAGFYLLMPFKIATSNLYVLVARGWVPRNAADRTKMPPLVTPEGMIEIEGTARHDIGHVMQLGAVDAPRPHAIVQNLDIASFAEASQLKMAPILLEQLSDTKDGLVRDWPVPSSGVEKHRGYAFQWYGLAAMAFIFFVVTGIRRGTK
ncbi:SURF1 family protein [Herminiimonas arsenitoxidans]|uniref:SURF1 family protein n=1 Tax=Herminiimonas arsenitoxidans TaxID=1809410 RepID=UPI0009705C9B|nr:SURF1 family protein [Herminiimonas arsenitoxidans]